VVSDVFFDFFGTLVDYNPSVHPAYNAPLAFARRAGCAISAAESDAYWQEAWDRHEAHAVSTGREYSMREVALRYWRSIGSPPPRTPSNASRTSLQATG
jgi:putative hydrolase of the HAD superfamily